MVTYKYYKMYGHSAATSIFVGKNMHLTTYYYRFISRPVKNIGSEIYCPSCSETNPEPEKPKLERL